MNKTIGAILILLGIGLMIIPFVFLSEETSKIGKCYDRYGNEIIGEKCNVTNYYLTTGGIILLILGIIIYGIGLIMVLTPGYGSI